MRTGMMHTLIHRWRLAVAVVLSSQLLYAGPGIAEEDHLMGYKIKDLNQIAPPANPYVVDNELTAGGESCVLKKPQFFLVQSDKNGDDDDRGGEPGHFVCYKAKCTDAFLPPPTEQDSQFGVHNLETKKAKLVCLPVNPPPPPCAGVLVGGFCWFLGAAGDSCDATCAAQSLTCDPATVTYVGDGASTASQCDAVLDALSGPDFTNPNNIAPGAGCYVLAPSVGQSILGIFAPPTSCAASQSNVSRACACS